MKEGWRSNLLETGAEAAELLRSVQRIAVLGIKTEAHAGQPAFFVPEYLKRVGYEVIPVPVHYPGVTRILGQPVFRSIAEIPGPIDLVVVFRRSSDVAAHLDDLIAARPRAVWFQTGIRNDEAARQLAEQGIRTVQDRCTMVDHRRIRPA